MGISHKVGEARLSTMARRTRLRVAAYRDGMEPTPQAPFAERNCARMVLEAIDARIAYIRDLWGSNPTGYASDELPAELPRLERARVWASDALAFYNAACPETF